MNYPEWRFHYQTYSGQWYDCGPGYGSLDEQIYLSQRLGQRFWIEHYPEGRP